MKKIVLNIIFCLKLLFRVNSNNFIILFFANFISLLNPFVNLYITRILINELVLILSNFSHDNVEHLYGIILAYAGANIIMRFLNDYVEKLTELHLKDMVSYIDINLMKKSTEIDISYFDIPENFDIISHSRENAKGLYQVIFSIIRLFNHCISITIYITIALKTSIVMSGIVLILLIPGFCFKAQIDKKSYNFSKEQFRDIRKNNYIYKLLFSPVAAKEIRFFDIGCSLSAEYRNKAEELVDAKINFTKNKKIQSILLDIPSFLLQGVINIFIIIKILKKEKMLGDYSFFTSVYNNLYHGILGLAGILAEFMAFSDKINDFKQYFLLNDSSVKSGTLILDEIEMIQFVNVTFRYPKSNRIVLDKVTFKINKGEWVLLIGLNGSGKSTIIKLLARFYDPNDGQILVNGKDITLYDIKSIRNKMNILFQDYNIYSMTIKENVTIGDLNSAKCISRIEEAMSMANINYLLYKKSVSIDTFVTKVFDGDGIEMSGGEKQKMALARAFFKNSNVVILDEPSAALDTFSENHVLDKLKKRKKNQLIMMISHKLLHVKYADKIILLKGGKVEAQGSHEKLFKTNKEYKRMYNIQLKKYRTEIT